MIEQFRTSAAKTEEPDDTALELIDQAVPHPSVIDLITLSGLTPARIAETALAYRDRSTKTETQAFEKLGAMIGGYVRNNAVAFWEAVYKGKVDVEPYSRYAALARTLSPSQRNFLQALTDEIIAKTLDGFLAMIEGQDDVKIAVGSLKFGRRKKRNLRWLLGRKGGWIEKHSAKGRRDDDANEL